MLKKINVLIKKLLSKNFALAIVCAVIIAFSSFLGYSSPLGVALCVYMPLHFGFVFLIALFITEIALGVNAFSLAAMFASLLVLLIKSIQQRFSVKIICFTQFLCAFSSYLALAVVFLIAFPSNLVDYIVAIVFSALNIMVLAALKNPSAKQMVAFLFFMLIASLSGIDLMYINIGRAFGIYSVLAIGVVSGAAMSCVAGIICACAVAAYNPEMFQSTVFVCIVGIICSGRGVKDKLRIPLYAIATSIICAVISGAGDYEIGFVVDTLMAVVAFILTEQKAVYLVSRFVPKSNDCAVISKILSSRSQAQLYSLTSLSTYLNSMLSSFAIKQSNPVDLIYSGVCLNCQNHDSCFCDSSSNIRTAFNNCKKQDDLLLYAENLKKQNDYVQKLNVSQQAKLNEAISVLDTVSTVVSDVSARAEAVKDINFELTKRLISSLKENRAECVSAVVNNDSSIYIEFSKHKRISEVRLCLLVSELMSIDYPMPEVTVLERTVRYSFCPKPLFSADYGFAQISAQADSCGDNFDSFTVGGRLYCILCDGMGTGGLAQTSSSHIISLIKRQLLCDCSACAAVELSSLIMRLTTHDESFSTLDLLSIDLQTGKLEFYKAGACQSFIIGEGIRAVPGGGYPIGILNDVDMKLTNASVISDSVIIMLTDGAKDISGADIEKTLKEFSNFSSDEIAENIIKNSFKDSINARPDDITVAVIKIEKRK